MRILLQKALQCRMADKRSLGIRHRWKEKVRKTRYSQDVHRENVKNVEKSFIFYRINNSILYDSPVCIRPVAFYLERAPGLWKKKKKKKNDKNEKNFKFLIYKRHDSNISMISIKFYLFLRCITGVFGVLSWMITCVASISSHSDVSSVDSVKVLPLVIIKRDPLMP